MAKALSLIKTTIYFLLLAITLQCANSARFLDEVDTQPPIIADAPQPIDPIDVDDVAPIADTSTTLPSGQFPATTPAAIEASPPEENVDVAPVENADVTPVVSPTTTVSSGTNSIAPVSAIVPDENVDDVVPIASPTTTLSNGPSSVAPVSTTVPVTSPTTLPPGGPVVNPTTSAATVANPGPQNSPLSFFMHDILSGTHPSARVVTGIVSNSQINGLPFSKPNGQVFPINGGVPLPNNINGIINNNNNLPFLTGLNGGAQSTNTIIQNNGNNNVQTNGNTQPFVTAGQIPSGATLQQLMFGSVTVIDDELTEGHELGSAVVGKAQGFYLASSLDGTSQTMALTVLLHGDGHDHEEDTISFFGVHRTASPESQIAVIGGTGKYENAKGYANIETIHQEDQHTTDGVDTIIHINVYLSH